MLSMMYKEFVVLRTAVLVYAATAILFEVRLIPVGEPIVFITLLPMFFTFSTASHEDKNNSHMFVNSLPVDRKEIVSAKYAFHIVCGIVFIGIAVIHKVIFDALPPGIVLKQAGIAAAVVVWFVSFFFPMYFWLGPRFVQIGMIFLFIIMFTAVPIVYNLGVKHNFWGIFDIIQSLPSYFWFILITAITVIIFIASRFISVWLYERKQF